MLKYLAKTFSISIAVIAAVTAATWPMRADMIDGAMVVSRNILPPNIQTKSYTITQSDAFRPAVWMTGGTTITLPSAGNIINGSQIKVCNSSANDSTHHAVLQPNFPGPAFVRLWMGQCEEVTAVNGSWQVSVWQGRWRPFSTPQVFIDTGGNDNNDGLVSTATAISSVQQFFNLVKYEWDSQSLIPQGLLTSGQTFTGCPIFQYRDAGVVYLVGNGGTSTLRSSCNVVLELSDFGGYVILGGVNLDCTSAASHPCYGLFIHQQNGVDLSNGASPSASSVTFTGADTTDIGLWCDAQCRVNAAAAVVFGGTFKTLMAFDYGSMAQLNSGVTFSNNLTISGQGGFRAWRGSTMALQGTMTIGTTVNFSVGIFDASDMGSFVLGSTFAVSGTLGTGRQWNIFNNSLLCSDSSTAIPGTAGANSASAGILAGVVLGTSGSNCYPSFP